MSPEDATRAAQSILEKRAGDHEFRVFIDNPNDCKHSITAFKQLGCRVKVKQDGAVLVVTRPQ